MYCRNCGKQLAGAPELCLNCGAKPLVGNKFCHNCGAETNPLAEICLKCGAKLGGPVVNPNVSQKSRLAVALLAFFLGSFGIHRFYVGQIGTAVTMLVLTIVGFATFIFVVGFFFLAATGIWALVDFIVALVGKYKDKDGKLILTW